MRPASPAAACDVDIDCRKGGQAWQLRQKSVVARTFSGLGLVVPYDKKTELGYRPLSCTDKELKALLRRIATAKAKHRSSSGTGGKVADTSELDEMITWCNIANDECDFGMGLHLGLNLLAFDPADNSLQDGGEGAGHFGGYIRQLLEMCYMLLGRMAWSDVVRAHMQGRDRPSLSVLPYISFD